MAEYPLEIYGDSPIAVYACQEDAVLKNKTSVQKYWFACFRNPQIEI